MERALLEIDRLLWEEAALAFEDVTSARVIVPEPDCECLACHVGRQFLLPFLPVTWH